MPIAESGRRPPIEDSSPNKLMNIGALSEYLGVPKATIYDWNYRGVGPEYFKARGRLLWKKRDVDKWLAQSRGQ